MVVNFFMLQVRDVENIKSLSKSRDNDETLIIQVSSFDTPTRDATLMLLLPTYNWRESFFVEKFSTWF